MKGKKGRDTKFTKEIVAEIIKSLEIGHTQRDACTLAGISESVFYKWMVDPQKIHFMETVKKAELKSKDQAIKTVRKAFGTHWTSAAWWLERRHRDEFAIKQIHDGNINHNIRNYDEEAARRLAKYRPKQAR